ncbi:hypothetical protein T07_5681 [Trichinella nelsoni]|uniref:Uncharacterized protein n=1 Tax=Trichinella nelsoni TaxID=6336 RepID=A0A0V0RSQ6_9BILA|nr:hypothetical protein T07_5681 [Trichinella nelsoni]
MVNYERCYLIDTDSSSAWKKLKIMRISTCLLQNLRVFESHNKTGYFKTAYTPVKVYESLKALIIV